MIAGVVVPDSAVANEAERLWRAASPAALYRHGVRSYVFACLLAAADGLAVDHEALYVACILHDIGLTLEFESLTSPFEQVSADIADRLTAHHAWAEQRRHDVRRSIVLHLAAEVLSSEPPEAQALEAGVALDVTGRRLSALDPAAVVATLRLLPRTSFREVFTALMEQEAARKPHSQTAALMRGGLAGRLDAAPFADAPGDVPGSASHWTSSPTTE
jgi:hypothetical protein